MGGEGNDELVGKMGRITGIMHQIEVPEVRLAHSVEAAPRARRSRTRGFSYTRG